MTPAELDVLIHCHCRPTPHPNREAAHIRSVLKLWIADGIIERDEGEAGVYHTTQRGKRWLEMILDTPYPEHRWIDPREER